MFDLTALRKIYDTGKARDVYVAGRSGGGVETLGNLVEAVLEQVPVEVERHCGRLVFDMQVIVRLLDMSEQCLDYLHDQALCEPLAAR